LEQRSQGQTVSSYSASSLASLARRLISVLAFALQGLHLASWYGFLAPLSLQPKSSSGFDSRQAEQTLVFVIVFEVVLSHYKLNDDNQNEPDNH